MPFFIGNTTQYTTVAGAAVGASDTWPIIVSAALRNITRTEMLNIFQGVDATLTALAAQNWAANALPIGTGADTLSQTSFAANTFPARASTGNLVAKSITDASLTALATGLGTLATQNGTFSGTSSGTNTGDQTSVSGNAGTVTVADAAADTTTWVLLATSQTGNQAPASDAGLTYDASTNTLTAGAITAFGSTTQVQVNVAGVIGGATKLLYNTATSTVAITSISTSKEALRLTKIADQSVPMFRIKDDEDSDKFVIDVSGIVTTGVWEATTVAVNKGGTGQTSYTDGQLLIGNTSGNTLTKATLTQGSGVTITNGNGTITIAASGGSPGGSDTQVQFNDSGVFGGDAGLVYNKTTDTLTVAGPIALGSTSSWVSVPHTGYLAKASGPGQVFHIDGVASGVLTLDNFAGIYLKASTAVLVGTGDATGTISAYPSSSGAGNALALVGSAAASGNTNGGSIVLTPGLKSGSGTDGTVIIKAASASPGANLAEVQNSTSVARVLVGSGGNLRVTDGVNYIEFDTSFNITGTNNPIIIGSTGSVQIRPNGQINAAVEFIQESQTGAAPVLVTANNNFQLGQTSATPATQTLRGTRTVGADLAGGALALASGMSTGNAAAPDILFQTSDPGASSSTVQTLSTKMTLKGSGGLLARHLVEANTAGSGAPNVLTAVESRTLLTNEGASAENYHTLPTAVAGLEFLFVVQDSDGIRITANTGDTIRPIAGTAASGAGGFIRCATLGAFIRLVAINAVEWIAIGSAGVWTIDV